MDALAPGVSVRTSDGLAATKKFLHDAENMSLDGFATLRAAAPARPASADSLVDGGGTVVTEVPAHPNAPKPPRTPPPTKRTLRRRPLTAPGGGPSVAGATLSVRRPEYDLDGKRVPGDPDVLEVVHSVHVMTEDPDVLPVPLAPRPESPLSVTF
jgi:hypothetical protein